MSLPRTASTTACAWVGCCTCARVHVFTCSRCAKTSANLGAEEGVGENGMCVVAVAERDELEAINGEHVTGREHEVVHAVHVEGAGGGDATGEGPSAGHEYRMPGGDERGR